MQELALFLALPALAVPRTAAVQSLARHCLGSWSVGRFRARLRSRTGPTTEGCRQLGGGPETRRVSSAHSSGPELETAAPKPEARRHEGGPVGASQVPARLNRQEAVGRAFIS